MIATINLGWAIASLVIGALIWAVVIARLWGDLRASRQVSEKGAVEKDHKIGYDDEVEGHPRNDETDEAEDERDEA